MDTNSLRNREKGFGPRATCDQCGQQSKRSAMWLPKPLRIVIAYTSGILLLAVFVALFVLGVTIFVTHRRPVEILDSVVLRPRGDLAVRAPPTPNGWHFFSNSNVNLFTKAAAGGATGVWYFCGNDGFNGYGCGASVVVIALFGVLRIIGGGWQDRSLAWDSGIVNQPLPFSLPDHLPALGYTWAYNTTGAAVYTKTENGKLYGAAYRAPPHGPLGKRNSKAGQYSDGYGDTAYVTVDQYNSARVYCYDQDYNHWGNALNTAMGQYYEYNDDANCGDDCMIQFCVAPTDTQNNVIASITIGVNEGGNNGATPDCDNLVCNAFGTCKPDS